MKMPALVLGTSLLMLVLGCGKKSTLDEPVNPEKGGEVLQVALDSWKKGENYGDLPKRNPPIYFNEPEWESGKKLVEFKAGSRLGPLEQFFGLANALEDLLGRPVDLVEPSAIKNPFIRAGINRSREVLYGS